VSGGDAAKAPEPSMEEILASIRRIISDDPNAGRPALIDEEAQVAAPQDDDVLDLAKVAQDATLAEETPAPDDIAFRDVSEAEPIPEPVSEPVMAQSAQQPEHVEPSPVEPPPNERIMSPDTDATVTHAFRSLANTILTNNARTLEDLVREMMRPMLKTWLDDNLPALVERLVRAEIERVARGGR
jgi:cell pole-organizing protein PopZ